MSSPLNDAAANALRIMAEVNPGPMFDHENLMMRPEEPAFIRTVQAAAVLAEIERAPGFTWNEGRTTDWETCCARIARFVESGKPINCRVIAKLCLA